MQPKPVKLSAYLLSVSSDKVSIRFTSLISSHVFKPSTFVTLSRISNSIDRYLFLCSHKRLSLPRDLSLCAVSFALDLVRICFETSLYVAVDMTLQLCTCVNFEFNIVRVDADVGAPILVVWAVDSV